MSNSIEKSIELKVPVSRVWRAITDHKEFGQWFKVSLDGPFVPGRECTGHMTHPGYEHMKWTAMVKDMEPETLFSFTWHPYAIDMNKDYSDETPTLVEFKLEPIETGTRLVVTESGFDEIPEYRRDEAFRMDEKGWSGQIRNIEKHVTDNP